MKLKYIKMTNRGDMRSFLTNARAHNAITEHNPNVFDVVAKVDF